MIRTFTGNVIRDTVDINTSTVLDFSNLGDMINVNSASDVYLTIPNNSVFPIGSTVQINRLGTGDVYVDAASPQVIITDTGFRLNGQNSTGYLTKVDSTTWSFYGDTLTGGTGIAPFLTEYLVVAGGGASGATQSLNAGGGGGAGGLLHGFISVNVNTTHPIIVGAGGVGTTSSFNAGNGHNSRFSSFISIGGGGGGNGILSTNNSSELATGKNGGSGGGGGAIGNIGYPGGLGTVGQGNAGQSSYGRGGGAGSSAGAGLQFDISGVSSWYAGGGLTFSGTSNAGGGRPDSSENGNQSTNGVVNTGGGGGGRWGSNLTGRNGGSGIVILKIPSVYNAVFSAGVSNTLSTSISGFKIYTITATSTTSETVTFNVA